VPADALARSRRDGVIRIGYAVEAPYAFALADGTVTGESPAVASRIVARLGIPRIAWIQTEFGSLIPELEAGRFEVVAAGLFITRGRAARVSFSEPSFRVRQALLVRRGNPLRLHSYAAAARHPAARVAVLQGAVEGELLRRLGMPAARLVAVPDALAGRVAVEAGLADALALSSPTVQLMARRQQLGLTEGAEPFEQLPEGTVRHGYGGFAFRKADRELLAAWNRELKRFIGSEEHRDLVAPFGFGAAELPGAATTAEILAEAPP
jgi:polar amino acid transport system substrate-binding protein